jgi:NAD(P)-dependent dehydrogenase (short-subunit alcohol dehydrogenase family)
MAHALAEAGAQVAIAERIMENAEKVVGEIKALGRRAVAVSTDVSDYESVKQMVKNVHQEFGRIDILINNAGVVYKPATPGGSVSIPTEDVDPENWDRVVKINLCGVFYCAQLVGREMIQQKSGSIINIASVNGFTASVGRSNNAYCASKGGVVMFTRQLAGDWAKYGIRVNAIAPGYIETKMGSRALEDPEIEDLIPRITPMTRPGVPDDLKGLVVFLASEASGYITGQSIIIDGGYTVW